MTQTGSSPMNSQLMALRVAGTIFGLVCLAQIIRFLLGADVAVADHHLPLWPSAIAAVMAVSPIDSNLVRMFFMSIGCWVIVLSGADESGFSEPADFLR